MMATTNHTTLLDFTNVFEGQNTKTMVKREDKIERRIVE
jgi:hypothetical protein